MNPSLRRAAAALAAGGSCVLAPSLALGAPLLRLATTAGLMQQPTSHYYCAVYGLAADVGTESEGLIARASYVERPEFRSAGFADKEYGWFGLVGTKVTKKTKGHGLYAFLGAGRMQGYVAIDERKIDPSTLPEGTVRRRTFSLPGPTAALEYGARFGRIDIAASHQTFIGYVDKTQLDAFVAWPYNFFQLNVGYAW